MSITVQQFAAKLEALGQGKALAALLRKEMIITGLSAQGATQGLINQRLRVRSGFLQRSPAFRVEEVAALPELHVSAGGGQGKRGELRYAALQEYGGTVRPVKGKFLAIPVGPALTGAGVARYASARDVPGLSFIPTAGGGAVLGKSKGRGKNARMETWFILRRQVTIQGRYFVRDGTRPAFAAFGDRMTANIARLLVPSSPAPSGAP